MPSKVLPGGSTRASKFKSATFQVVERSAPFSGGFVVARESSAAQAWVHRGTCRRANSSPSSQHQYHQRLRDARAAADLEFSRLLSGTDLGKRRARSATDAGVLRRKGRLKEQDELIYFMMSMHKTHSCEEVFSKMQRWLSEHKADPRRSKLKQLVPSVGAIFTELPLQAAFKEFDSFFTLSRRRFVLPNFAEIRHILNIAQIHASAEGMRLITFDADGTLYADGTHLEHDNRMIDMMISLMQRGIHVAVVTAAGYPGEPLLFEARIHGLLDAFQARNLPQDVTDRFLMLGGECNYLLRYNVPTHQLQFVPDELWKSKQMQSWTQEDIKYVLDSAEALLTDCASTLRVPVSVIRKERAVGVVPDSAVVYEQLEELAISAAYHLVDMPVPFCAFNGGADVFVDIGNKSLGLHALMNFLGAKSEQTLHVGDRFTKSGNDAATRDCCPILWVAAPEETCFFIDMLLDDIENLRESRYIE